MLRIRLRRKGKKNQPFFQIVVTDQKNPPRGGRATEIVGFVNPVEKTREVKKERVEYWLSVGAQPSDRVHNLLVEEGVVDDEKRSVHPIEQGVEPSEEAQETEEEFEDKAEEEGETEEETEEKEAKETVEDKEKIEEETEESSEEETEEAGEE